MHHAQTPAWRDLGVFVQRMGAYSLLLRQRVFGTESGVDDDAGPQGRHAAPNAGRGQGAAVPFGFQCAVFTACQKPFRSG